MIKVLGSPDDPRVDIIGIIYKYDLPLEFPTGSARRSRERISTTKSPQRTSANIAKTGATGRCSPSTPSTRRDFDDAICVTERDNGSHGNSPCTSPTFPTT